jgi:hypothetical protein
MVAMQAQIPTIATAAKITPAAKVKRLKTKDHESRKTIKMLKKILKANEWSGDSAKKTCPECRAKKKDGHLAGCAWAEALREGDE